MRKLVPYKTPRITIVFFEKIVVLNRSGEVAVEWMEEWSSDFKEWR